MSNGCNNNKIFIVVGKVFEVEVKVDVIKKECKYIAKIKNINEIKFDLSDNIGKQKYYYLFGKSSNCDLCRTYIDVIKVYTCDERIFDVLKLAFEKGYIAEVGFYIDNSNPCDIKPDDCYKVLYVNLRKPQEEI